MKTFKSFLFPMLIIGILATGVVAGMTKPNAYSLQELLGLKKEAKPAEEEFETHKASETIYSVRHSGDSYEIVIKKGEKFKKQTIPSDAVVFSVSEVHTIEYEFEDVGKTALLKATISAPSEDWVSEDCPNFVIE